MVNKIINPFTAGDIVTPNWDNVSRGVVSSVDGEVCTIDWCETSTGRNFPKTWHFSNLSFKDNNRHVVNLKPVPSIDKVAVQGGKWKYCVIDTHTNEAVCMFVYKSDMEDYLDNAMSAPALVGRECL